MDNIRPENYFSELLRQHQDAEVDAQLQAEAIELRAEELFREALVDSTLFSTINQNYEVIDDTQVCRALRELDKAIIGDRFAIDAVYTALTQLQNKLMFACKNMAVKGE